MSEIRNTQQQVNKKKYDENFDAIFRKPRNRVRCRKCGDVIESKTRHDFVPCKCGAIFTDGGNEYCHRGGNPEDMENLP
jgi:hypothetical protein